MAKLTPHPQAGHPLLAALEPFLYVEIADPVIGWKPGVSVRVVGHLIAPAGVDVTENTRATREAVYRQAEDAIAAVEAIGCILIVHPEIRVHGPEASVELFLEVPS